MQKSLSRAKQKSFLILLREIREDAGLRQLDVATRLDQPQSFVSKYESGERRLDLLELEQVCNACDTELVEFVRRYTAVVDR
ncbi:MAG: transcriptional regulator [Planctomycetes bacterium]|jgi:transcriptional regulator with XRE-family HTH domain|nr:transcriptional regulator [Planctomycetota bacterium]